jgi:sec-independent protein translocase protein TatA
MVFAFLNAETILFLAVIGVLVFGRKMPELGRSLGQTFKEFQKGIRGVEDQV